MFFPSFMYDFFIRKKKPYVESVCITDIGKIRKTNEDNFYFDGYYMPQNHRSLSEPLCSAHLSCAPLLFAVLDGMGGESLGELASYIGAVKIEELLKYKSISRNLIFSTIYDMNHSVNMAASENKVSHMGSTLSLLLFDNNKVWIANLGDSPVFLKRNGQLTLLNRMHTAFTNDISKKQGHKPALTQFLGIPDTYPLSPYISEFEIKHDDIFLICSDGLSDMISVNDIEKVLSSNNTLKEKLTCLLTCALEKGGCDNITIILCQVD